jgi:hypothetical protein
MERQQDHRARGTSVSMLTGCAHSWWKRAWKPVLSRKLRATPAVPKIFDGEKEAKLIALACSVHGLTNFPSGGPTFDDAAAFFCHGAGKAAPQNCTAVLFDPYTYFPYRNCKYGPPPWQEF